MTLRDVAGDVMRRQEPARAHEQVWAERGKLLRTDRLTGLNNQLGWDEALDEAMFSAARFGGPLVVARIDLDQSAGEDLRSSTFPVTAFASRARRAVRNADIFARLDGHALVVALSRCPRPVAASILERIRTSVGDGETCSVGWAVWDRHEPAESLMARAQQALALALDAGGNQVVAA